MKEKINIKLPREVNGKQLAEMIESVNKDYFKVTRHTYRTSAGYELGKEGIAVETRRYFDEVTLSKYDAVAALKNAGIFATSVFFIWLAPVCFLIGESVRAKLYHDIDYDTLTFDKYISDDSRFEKTFKPKLMDLVSKLYSEIENSKLMVLKVD